MKVLEKGRVTSVREIRPAIFSLWANAPEICASAKPGQFIHVRVADQYLPLLRRPLSIGRVVGEEVELVWRVVGEGTRLLAELREGDFIDLLGPLGHPFTIPARDSHSILVGADDKTLLEGLAEHWPVQRLQWFTHGFMAVRSRDAGVVISDLRMGVEPTYNFNYRVAGITASGITPEPATRVDTPWQMEQLLPLLERVLRPIR